MAYIPHKKHRVGLGATTGTATPLASTASATSLFDIDELVGNIVEGVTGEVIQGVTSSIDRGMDRATSVISDGLDRFVDSPKGAALFNKIGEKAEGAILQVVSNQKTNLALLGVAGVAMMIGSVSVGSRMNPAKSKLAFGIGAAALAVIALGLGSPPKAPMMPPVKIPGGLPSLPLPRKTLP